MIDTKDLRTTVGKARMLNPTVACVTLTSNDPDSRPFHICCSVPGGRPWATFDLGSQQVITITNAPECDNGADLRRFVLERFAD